MQICFSSRLEWCRLREPVKGREAVILFCLSASCPIAQSMWFVSFLWHGCSIAHISLSSVSRSLGPQGGGHLLFQEGESSGVGSDVWRRWQPGGDQVSVVKFISSMGKVSVSERSKPERCPLWQGQEKKKNLGCNFGYTARCGKILLNFWGYNFTINVFIRIFQAHSI